MGWTAVHREAGMSDRAFYELELAPSLATNGRILACATVGGVFYAVVENRLAAPYRPGARWMLVVFQRRRMGPYNFAYKEMTESDGPGAHRCPRRLLELLEEQAPEPPNDWAAEWRRACWANVHKVERAAKFVTRGTIVYFREPLSFGHGQEVLSEFTFEERSTFRHGGRRYRIPNWRTDEWSLTPFPPATSSPS